MPNVRTLQRSFAGGEVSPEMFGRIDDAKYQSGAAKMLNFIAKPQGPTENRPGFAFVNEVKDSTKKVRLIPFTYSTTQTMMIEMGAGYFRFHTQGATLLEAAKNITGITQSAGVVTSAGHGYSNGDWLYLTGIVGMTELNGRYVVVSDTAANTFRMKDAGGTYITTGSFTAYSSGGTCARVYKIANSYAEADLFDIHYVQSADVLTLVHPGYAPQELRRVSATNWTLSTVSFAAPISAPAAPTVTASGHTTAKYDYTYVVTAIAADGVSESVASSSDTDSGNLLETGGIVTISWSAVLTASRYHVYKLQGGLYGYIGQTAGTSIIDDNIAPDLSKTPPTYDSVFGGAGEYPAAVSYFEQRRCFAGTTNSPQSIWMTKSGTETDMSYGLPIRDDDRIKFRVAAREANTIRHIVPLSQLLLLTSSAEWRVASVNSDAITPSSISVKPQSYVGASNVQPVIVNNTLLYGAARGGHVRELAYNWQANGFITGDLSLRAPHLFDSYDVSDMTYAKAPLPMVWFVSSSGKLLGFTYVPEQQVGAWHQHDTDGTYESCAAVAEGSEDRLYVVVKRTVNGRTVRYIERMASRAFSDPEDAFFVDCGSTYDSPVAQTLTPGTGATTLGTTGVTFTAGGAAFVSGDVGRYIRYRYAGDDGYVTALARITGYTSSTVVTATIERAFPSTSAIASGGWALTVTTIRGLNHLEGKVVSVLADGAVHPQCRVTGGAISLDNGAAVVQVGLPITADLQTLPLAMQIDNGFGQGRYKNVNKAWIRVYRSSGIFVGPSASELVEAKQRTTEDYGQPPTLKSEEIQVMLTPTWADSGQVYIRQADPLPLTIVSLTLEVAVGG